MFHIFPRRKSSTVTCQLSIKDIAPAPLTPEPDDAELAAQALLESGLKKKNSQLSTLNSQLKKGSPAYYQALSEKIKAAHAAEARAAMRYVAFVESELSTKPNEPHEPQEPNGQWSMVNGQFSTLESGLFRHQDTVEREGGALLRRWQHCLADITVRSLMVNGQ